MRHIIFRCVNVVSKKLPSLLVLNYMYEKLFRKCMDNSRTDNKGGFIPLQFVINYVGTLFQQNLLLAFLRLLSFTIDLIHNCSKFIN